MCSNNGCASLAAYRAFPSLVQALQNVRPTHTAASRMILPAAPDACLARCHFMPRPIHAVIHQPAIANNLEVARRHAPGSRIWAVVKANAYGHGIRRVFAGLRATDGFGLLDLNEAVLLRDLGWQGPILLLEGFFQPQDVPLIEQYRLTTAIHCDEQLRMLESARPKGPLAIQLKLNTGMNRLGFHPSQYRAAWERARAMPCVGSIVHMTHFPMPTVRAALPTRSRLSMPPRQTCRARPACPTRPPSCGIPRRTARGCGPASSCMARRRLAARPTSPVSACSRPCRCIAS